VKVICKERDNSLKTPNDGLEELEDDYSGGSWDSRQVARSTGLEIRSPSLLLNYCRCQSRKGMAMIAIPFRV